MKAALIVGLLVLTYAGLMIGFQAAHDKEVTNHDTFRIQATEYIGCR